MSAVRLTEVMRGTLVCALAGCVLLSLVPLIELGVPSWDGRFMIAFGIAAAAEAYLSFRLIKRAPSYEVDTGRVTGIELGALFLALQLCIDRVKGVAPFEHYFPHLDGQTAALFLIVLVFWLAAGSTARDLDTLDRNPRGAADLSPARRRLSFRFWFGGMLAVAASGLTQIRVDRMLDIPVPAHSGPVLNVAAYFLLGMLLLEHVEYSALRGRWQRGNIAIGAGLGGRWARYSLTFVGVAAVGALLLPTGHTVGLIELGRAIWAPLSSALIQLISWFHGPLNWLVRLIGPQSPPAVRPRVLPHLPPHLHRPPPAHRPAHGGGFDLTPLRTIVFWLVVLAALVYLLRNVQPRQAARLPVIGALLAAVLGGLGRAWSAVRALLRGYGRRVVERVPGVKTALRAVPAIVPRVGLPFRRLGALSERERALYYYLSVVQRARQRGVARRAAQTPHAFSAELAPRLPEAGDDLETVTAAFVQARYSRREITGAELERARSGWQRVRAALRRMGR